MFVEVDGVQPGKGVEKPFDVGELSSVLFEADSTGLGVIPFGGGTRLGVGSLPEKFDLGIEMSGLNQMVSHNPADLTCTVEAGMSIDQLQSILAEHGQFLAIDTPSPKEATVGGTIASLPPGYLRWQLGHPRDTVIGMEVVLANGTTTKSGGQVVKNVSGYDMARLHIGGFGTLGVITKVSFKLTPSPRKEISLQISFSNSKFAHEFGQAVFNSFLMPLSLACVHGSDSLLDSHGDGVTPNDTVECVVRFGGRENSCERQVKLAKELSRRFEVKGIGRYDDCQSRNLWVDLRDAGTLPTHNFPIVGRMSVVPSKLDQVERVLSTGLIQELASISLVCQPGFGALLMFIEADVSSLGTESGVKLLKEIRGRVNRLGHALIFEKVPSEWKAWLDIWDMDQISSLKQMVSLKRTYDPNFTLSPGRFISDQ